MATQPPPPPAHEQAGPASSSPQTGITPPPITAAAATATATATAPNREWQSQSPIPHPLLRRVYASDQAMYPAAPSYARLRAWVDACPDLALCFFRSRDGLSESHGSSSSDDAEDAKLVAGVVIVLPLKRRHWEDLLCGRIKEKDVDPEVMFPWASSLRSGEGLGEGLERETREEEVGLHVYHIERFETESEFVGGLGETRRERGAFSEYALEEVVRRVQTRFAWRVIGVSALAATPAGKRAFERLGFTPTGYRELFVEKGAGEGSAVAKEQQMEMICLYPGDESSLEKAGGAAVASMSEMAVKYGSFSTWSGQWS